MAKKNITTEQNGVDTSKFVNIHKSMGFQASEAYRLLRTNIFFTLPDENKCRVIGVTSSISGEGKTTTSINLSYSLAKAGKKVLLIDGDMRLPSVGKIMGIEEKQGLSNFLVSSKEMIISPIKSGVLDNWYIMTSGDIPPNPSELLGSKRMKLLIDTLSTGFDFIIIDLPPVNIVIDALVVTPVLDGIAVVVREDYTDTKSLKQCIRQLKMSEAKILGFIMNASRNNQAKRKYGYRYYRRRYSKYSKYSNYGYNYGYGYGYGYGGYGQAAEKAKKEQIESTENK